MYLKIPLTSRVVKRPGITGVIGAHAEAVVGGCIVVTGGLKFKQALRSRAPTFTA